MLNRLAQLREERDNGDRGFTLIELLVVVVIIGILIAIAIPLYLNYKKGAADKSTQSDLRGAISTLEQCNSDTNAYPATVTFTGGAATPCPNQRINTSAGTTLTYFPKSSTDQTAYIIYGTNSGGNVDGTAGGSYYCYSSAVGGSVVKKSPAAATPSGYTAAC
ncbi:MAG TPA: prepilin-type N-terminal cleavage/methylation domain-containing protein [Jatrophihabitans sp.]|jgi:type IV pilus assembly protein PilA|uniref:prepilin-type N-terminal cleavage/methylation domain-containing protein n=1 Tax=Jatrophihabitans sp. TaxID=1932789 RepID=UPI002E0B939E|nr:prepilin-type N-terminal cleavage/methylation domain-containing protein [Jatrophihabitans sp.]